MVHKIVGRVFLVAAAIVVLAATTTATAQWQVESKDGSSSIKFGYLAQARGDWLESADGESTAQDLYFRRLRLLFGGKLSPKWSFFFETDSPNLGKSAAGVKGAGDVYIQDFVITYTHNDALSVDVGMLLPGNSHNSNQSAASLLAVDYGPYSFLNSGPIDARVGRDYGVRLRGYPFKKHLEYRLEVLDGNRGPDANRPFRTSVRLVYYPFEAETGLYYSGTNLGKKKILAIGANYDAQEDYELKAFDVYWDWPIAGGNGVTLQGDYIQEDGGTTLPSLAKQDSLLIEAGFFIAKAKLSPFVQYADRDFDDPEAADTKFSQIGLAFWLKGHNRALKLGYGRLETDGAPDRDLVQLQLQVLQF